MNRSYALLFAATVLLGLILVALGRTPRRDPVPPATSPGTGGMDTIFIAIRGGTVTSPARSVRKGAGVLLRVANLDGGRVRFTLAGYEDRIGSELLAPGGVLEREFVADRPGEGFAWLIDGRPSGRFAVTGSHLVEGHR